MPDTSLLQTILALEEERRKQPSGGQKVIASLQQMMDGVAKGIQLYDNVRTIKDKYGSTQVTPPTPATSSAPAIAPVTAPVVPGAEFRTGTAFTPGTIPTFTPGAPTPAGAATPDLSGILGQLPSQPVIPGQAAIPGSVGTPGTSIKNTDLARIMEIAKVYPDLARQAGTAKGVDLGQTMDERKLSQLAYVQVTDAAGNPVGAPIPVPKGTKLSQAQSETIIVDPVTGETKTTVAPGKKVVKATEEGQITDTQKELSAWRVKGLELADKNLAAQTSKIRGITEGVNQANRPEAYRAALTATAPESLRANGKLTAQGQAQIDAAVKDLQAQFPVPYRTVKNPTQAVSIAKQSRLTGQSDAQIRTNMINAGIDPAEADRILEESRR